MSDRNSAIMLVLNVLYQYIVEHIYQGHLRSFGRLARTCWTAAKYARAYFDVASYHATHLGNTSMAICGKRLVFCSFKLPNSKPIKMRMLPNGKWHGILTLAIGSGAFTREYRGGIECGIEHQQMWFTYWGYTEIKRVWDYGYPRTEICTEYDFSGRLIHCAYTIFDKIYNDGWHERRHQLIYINSHHCAPTVIEEVFTDGECHETMCFSIGMIKNRSHC